MMPITIVTSITTTVIVHRRCPDGMQTLFQVRAHQDDTNAVAYLDDSANLIVSGSDDSLIKVGTG